MDNANDQYWLDKLALGIGYAVLVITTLVTLSMISAYVFCKLFTAQFFTTQFWTVAAISFITSGLVFVVVPTRSSKTRS